MKPIKIKANKNISNLIVNWDDGHVSTYSFSLLRLGCPCATCRGGHENMTPEPDPKIFDMEIQESELTTLINLELVGSYAVKVLWKDGHDYGIFTWDYLRAMCPCDICRGKKNKGKTI